MKRKLLAFQIAVAVTALLASYSLCRWLAPFRATPKPLEMKGDWITMSEGSGYVGYYRHNLDLPGNARNAWLAVAARDTFEVAINGQVLGSQSLWRPNRSYQFTMSERGQRLNDMKAIPWVSYPRDYQWQTYANYRLPSFFDISRALKPGRNSICIRVDSRKAPTLVCVDGAVTLDSGESIPVTSSTAWKTAATPRKDISLDWTDREYNDVSWEGAQKTKAPGPVYSTFDPGIFTDPFTAHWLRVADDGRDQSIVFETKWKVGVRPKDAWLRVMTNRAYDLYINGEKAEPPSLGPSELSSSDWILHTSYASGRQWRPDALDPDDVGELFDSEDDEDDQASTQSGMIVPPALLRDREVGTFDAYSVASMLKAGENTISIRLVSRDPSLKWSPQFALDGCAVGAGRVSRLVSTPAAWTARLQSPEAQSQLVSVLEGGPAIGDDSTPPKKRYLGACYSKTGKWFSWFGLCGGVFLLLFAAGVACVRRATGEGDTADRARFLAGVTIGFIATATVLSCAVILDCCFAARDEVVWMLMAKTWVAILSVALISGTGAFFLAYWSRNWAMRVDSLLPKGHFRWLVCGLLVVCGLTRAYKLDFQPTDADEWASLQTVLAIVDTGTPKLTDDVFYTRSPFYHYATAASVAVFGRNFWAMRLPSAGFAVATCALIYLFGAKLLRRRWTGFGAALLFTIHPLAIDMGHQIRFYQQQQFFALLTLYYFCQGFVGTQQMKSRYLFLASFFAAVFSQEISVMIGFTLVASYVLFAEGKDWRTEAKWWIAAGCGLVFVVLDLVIFQTVCLTRLEGISPSIEPALKLNLMYPSKLYWIFSLFSRLHFGLSAVFFVGLPFALKGRNRNILALYLTFFGGIIFSTILITGSGLRFQYWLFPIFFLLTVHGAQEFAAAIINPTTINLGRQRYFVRWAVAAMLVTMIGLSWSPWKIPGSYSTKILPDVDGAFSYVRQNIAPGDALAVAAPHTTAALTEVGRVDYDIESPLLYDFVYRKEGRLIDRNAGAQVISRLDELQDACAKHERLWVVLNRDIHFRSPGERIAWQNPGGRFDLFVRSNCELVHQTYLTDVFLWDSSKGRLHGFRRDL